MFLRLLIFLFPVSVLTTPAIAQDDLALPGEADEPVAETPNEVKPAEPLETSEFTPRTDNPPELQTPDGKPLKDAQFYSFRGVPFEIFRGLEGPSQSKIQSRDPDADEEFQPLVTDEWNTAYRDSPVETLVLHEWGYAVQKIEQPDSDSEASQVKMTPWTESTLSVSINGKPLKSGVLRATWEVWPDCPLLTQLRPNVLRSVGTEMPSLIKVHFHAPIQNGKVKFQSLPSALLRIMVVPDLELSDPALPNTKTNLASWYDTRPGVFGSPRTDFHAVTFVGKVVEPQLQPKRHPGENLIVRFVPEAFMVQERLYTVRRVPVENVLKRIEVSKAWGLREFVERERAAEPDVHTVADLDGNFRLTLATDPDRYQVHGIIRDEKASCDLLMREQDLDIYLQTVDSHRPGRQDLGELTAPVDERFEELLHQTYGRNPTNGGLADFDPRDALGSQRQMAPVADDRFGPPSNDFADRDAVPDRLQEMPRDERYLDDFKTHDASRHGDFGDVERRDINATAQSGDFDRSRRVEHAIDDSFHDRSDELRTRQVPVSPLDDFGDDDFTLRDDPQDDFGDPRDPLSATPQRNPPRRLGSDPPKGRVNEFDQKKDDRTPQSDNAFDDSRNWNPRGVPVPRDFGDPEDSFATGNGGVSPFASPPNKAANPFGMPGATAVDKAIAELVTGLLSAGDRRTRESLKQPLRSLLEQKFDAEQQAREKIVAELQKRLTDAQKKVKERSAKKAQIIDQQLQRVIGLPEDNFLAPEPAVEGLVPDFDMRNN